MAALKVVKGKELAKELPLLDGTTVIGRSIDCDIVLKNLTVSRRHARVSCTEEGHLIEDWSSPGIVGAQTRV
jgi:pSer/pThr/pTyr-binding forkhead associated (FHA) protein